jgi:hypothetical protein
MLTPFHLCLYGDIGVLVFVVCAQSHMRWARASGGAVRPGAWLTDAGASSIKKTPSIWNTAYKTISMILVIPENSCFFRGDWTR